MSKNRELTPEAIAFARRATELLADRPAGDAPITLRLGGEGAAEVEIPGPVLEVIMRTLALAAEGKKFRIVEEDDEVSPEKAAEFLRVSRPYLVKKLEAGEIPFHYVGSHRRIVMADLIEYIKRRRLLGHSALRRMRGQAEESGFYE
jgi:excisionase family DNA binding protein